jgi:hypothetical protein
MWIVFWNSHWEKLENERLEARSEKLDARGERLEARC